MLWKTKVLGSALQKARVALSSLFLRTYVRKTAVHLIDQHVRGLGSALRNPESYGGEPGVLVSVVWITRREHTERKQCVRLQEHVLCCRASWLTGISHIKHITLNPFPEHVSIEKMLVGCNRHVREGDLLYFQFRKVTWRANDTNRNA